MTLFFYLSWCRPRRERRPEIESMSSRSGRSHSCGARQNLSGRRASPLEEHPDARMREIDTTDCGGRRRIIPKAGDGTGTSGRRESTQSERAGAGGREREGHSMRRRGGRRGRRRGGSSSAHGDGGVRTEDLLCSGGTRTG